MPRASCYLFGGLSALWLSACSTLPATTPTTPETHADSGIVVASADTLGLGTTTGKAGSSADCEAAAGLGVAVTTSIENQAYLFDANGDPCQQAVTLFDGRLRGTTHDRAADPSIRIGFIDRFGPTPPAAPSTDSPALITTTTAVGQHPADLTSPAQVAAVTDAITTQAATPLALPAAPVTAPDPMATTVAQWQQAEEAHIRARVERELAAQRTVTNLAQDYTEADQIKTAAALAARLREAERQAAQQQQKYQEAMTRLEQLRQRHESGQSATQRNEAQLRAEVERLQQQNAEFQNRAQRLDAQGQQLQQAYQAKLADLASSLKVAEAEAASARQAAILQAAQQITEAERLAYAARVAERQALEREAARLQEQAAALAAQARRLPEGYNPPADPAMAAAYAKLAQGERVELPAGVIPVGTPPNGDGLDQAQIVLNAKDQPLATILTDVLKSLAPQLGQWQVQWALSEGAAPLAQAPWTVTAETTLNDFLAAIQQAIHQRYGITLSFQRFEQQRLLVISDSPAS